MLILEKGEYSNNLNLIVFRPVRISCFVGSMTQSHAVLLRLHVGVFTVYRMIPQGVSLSVNLSRFPFQIIHEKEFICGGPHQAKQSTVHSRQKHLV